MIGKLATLLCAGMALALTAASPAGADTIGSSNWAGYAVHRPGVRFTHVIGAWRQPHLKCVRRRESFSAMWIGLGGYSPSSPALEQIGTETDCSRSRHVESSAWYEQVPAPSRPIRLRVRPGDRLKASVSVSGRTVRLVLSDSTRHRTFRKTIQASSVDVSSAEWIVEAPSLCGGITSCHTLPLANFGTTRFTSAYVRASTGHSGSIGDATWRATKIVLVPGGRQFVLSGGAQNAGGGAVPSRLGSRGSSFTVRYSRVAKSKLQAAAADVRLPAERLYHAGRW
jgi:hypothetical protein